MKLKVKVKAKKRRSGMLLDGMTSFLYFSLIYILTFLWIILNLQYKTIHNIIIYIYSIGYPNDLSIIIQM